MPSAAPPLRAAVLALVALGSVSAVAAPAAAQWREQTWQAADAAAHAVPRVELAPAAAPRAQEPTGRLVFLGAVGGVAGMAAGAFAGYHLDVGLGSCNDYFCGAGGTLLGGALGMTLGSTLGVHAGNEGAGSLSATLLGGSLGLLAGTGTVALLAMAGAPGPALVVVPLVPAAQLAGAVIGQRRSARRDSP